MEGQVWAVDFDDVVADFNGGLVRYIKDVHNVVVEPSEVVSWEFWNEHPHSKNIWEKPDGVFHTETFTTHLNPIPRAVTFLYELARRGCEIAIFTNRPAEHARWVQEWLSNYGLTFDVFTTGDKNNKPEAARRWGATVVIDDNPHILREYDKEEQFDRVYGFKYPYNEDLQREDTRIIWVSSWKDVAQHEHGLKEGE